MTVPVAITVPDSTSTSCTALSRAPSHGTGMYFIYKILALTVYTAILSQFLTSTNQYQWYKLISFLCITPIVKYMTLYKKAKTDQRMMKQFIYTTITDSCGAIWMLYYVPRYFGGAWLGITPVLTTFIYMAIEALEYVLLDWGSDSTYVVKLAPNPADNMLVIVICTTYYFLGIHSNFMAPPTIWSFPKFIILWILLDFIFGICHHYCHHVPAMWKKHMLHHQYKREDLNSFANFYAEFTDSWFMNVGYLITAIGAVILGGDAHLLPIDAGIASVLTHSKYCNQHMMSMWMWEYDAIDLLFERTRLANYHNAHHDELNKYISLVGFFSDDFFLKYAPDLSTYFPQAYQTPKKVGK